MVNRWLYLEVIIRSSAPYARSSDAFSANGRRAESCAADFSRSEVGFHVHWCCLGSVSFDQRFSSLAMVVALVRLSFGAIT
jgi:hypothetical protein